MGPLCIYHANCDDGFGGGGHPKAAGFFLAKPDGIPVLDPNDWKPDDAD